MKAAVYCALLVILVFGCANPGGGQLEELKKETIAVHDEIMPRVEEIMVAKKSLREKMKALQKDTTLNQDSVSQLYTEAIVHLDEADEAMMGWMRNYSKLMDQELEPDSALQVFEGEKNEILRVKVLMNGSIEEANKLLKK